jgi:hypothetical protein
MHHTPLIIDIGLVLPIKAFIQTIIIITVQEPNWNSEM